MQGYVGVLFQSVLLFDQQRQRDFSRTLPKIKPLMKGPNQLLFFSYINLFLSKMAACYFKHSFFVVVVVVFLKSPLNFLWVHWSKPSSGGLDLIGRLNIEVLPDGVVVYGSTHGDKQVPDGVGKWNDAVTLEKDHPQTVTGSANQQFAQPRLLRLEGKKEFQTGSRLKSGQMFWINKKKKRYFFNISQYFPL